jgi:hypothetical protein
LRLVWKAGVARKGYDSTARGKPRLRPYRNSDRTEVQTIPGLRPYRGSDRTGAQTVLKGHGFIRAEKVAQLIFSGRGLQPAPEGAGAFRPLNNTRFLHARLQPAPREAQASRRDATKIAQDGGCRPPPRTTAGILGTAQKPNPKDCRGGGAGPQRPVPGRRRFPTRLTRYFVQKRPGIRAPQVTPANSAPVRRVQEGGAIL